MVHLWNPLLVGAIKRAGAANALVVHGRGHPHPGDNHLWRGLMLKNDFRQADLLVSLTAGGNPPTGRRTREFALAS